MSEPAVPPLRPEDALREALTAWAASFALIVLTFLVYRPFATAVATGTFLYVPLWLGRKRGEDARDFGFTTHAWRADLLLSAQVLAVLVPLFFGAFFLFAHALHLIPPRLAEVVTPLHGHVRLRFQLPPDFLRWTVHHLLVVALPEELFYRGFVQRRLRVAWPGGRRFLGITWGRAFWVTAILFALGHLAVLQVWRLAVFFPAILFGFMRERTGTVMGAAFVHAFCNLYEMVLERSFFV